MKWHWGEGVVRRKKWQIIVMWKKVQKHEDQFAGITRDSK